jgi:hypothetical protein
MNEFNKLILSTTIVVNLILIIYMLSYTIYQYITRYNYVYIFFNYWKHIINSDIFGIILICDILLLFAWLVSTIYNKL